MKDARVSLPLKLKNTSYFLLLDEVSSSEKELVGEDIEVKEEIDQWICNYFSVVV